MKHAYTLFALLLLSFSAFSQAPGFMLTFEDTTVTQQVYYTDSILDPAGIWQIGKPNKSLFDSAYLSENAVVTLLNSSLPVNIKASFIIAIPDTAYYPLGSILTFKHKYEFDSARSGGYVEYSIDSGKHWHNVLLIGAVDFYPSIGCILDTSQPEEIDGQYISPPFWWGYKPIDTTATGIPYFTGTDSVWVTDTILTTTADAGKTSLHSSLLFKFTAFADSNSQAKEGWMIDNIGFQNYVLHCPGGINEINSSHLDISPNPATNGFHIAITNEVADDYTAALYELTGREMMEKSFSGNETTLRRDGLAAGSYLVKVTNRRTLYTFEKRVIFE